jgi:hypothetical protein
MKDQEDFRKRKRLGPSKGRLSKAALDRLVEEAIVDCYNESEQATGLADIPESRPHSKISEAKGWEAPAFPRQN